VVARNPFVLVSVASPYSSSSQSVCGLLPLRRTVPFPASFAHCPPSRQAVSPALPACRGGVVVPPPTAGPRRLPTSSILQRLSTLPSPPNRKLDIGHRCHRSAIRRGRGPHELVCLSPRFFVLKVMSVSGSRKRGWYGRQVAGRPNEADFHVAAWGAAARWARPRARRRGLRGSRRRGVWWPRSPEFWGQLIQELQNF
jgi:hypothetical protein